MLSIVGKMKDGTKARIAFHDCGPRDRAPSKDEPFECYVSQIVVNGIETYSWIERVPGRTKRQYYFAREAVDYKIMDALGVDVYSLKEEVTGAPMDPLYEDWKTVNLPAGWSKPA